MSQGYHQQVAHERTELLRKIQRELPSACLDFFLSIEAKTTVLTRLAYAYDLRIFFQYLTTETRTFGDRDILSLEDADFGKITKRDIEQYASFLTLYYRNEENEEGAVISREIENKERGKMRKLASLRSFFRYLFADGRIEGNVAELVSLPKLHQQAIIRLDVDEVARILDIAESGEALSGRQQQYHKLTQKRDLAMITLFLGTGIRVSECVGINLDDVDFESNAFLITRKGGNEVMLYFSQEVADTLTSYYHERLQMEALPGHENALFLSLQKKRITQRAVENLVKKYARIAAPLKRKISPHKLRSTFGTNLYRESGDIYLVADVLGHADVNTTRKHYAAITEDRRRLAPQHTVLREDSKKSSVPPPRPKP